MRKCEERSGAREIIEQDKRKKKNSASLSMDRKGRKYNRSSKADNPENSKVGRRNDRSATNEQAINPDFRPSLRGLVQSRFLLLHDKTLALL